MLSLAQLSALFDDKFDARDVVTLGILTAMLLGVGWLIKQLQGTRKAIAEEILLEWEKRERERDVQRMPQPLQVQESHGAASRKDIDELHGRIKRERLEIDRAIAELKGEDVRLREKLDTDIADLHERINNVPERTIKLLRETKGLI